MIIKCKLNNIKMGCEMHAITDTASTVKKKHVFKHWAL